VPTISFLAVSTFSILPKPLSIPHFVPLLDRIARQQCVQELFLSCQPVGCVPLLHAFIDEAGDDGMAKQSPPWLTLAAIIYTESDVPATKRAIELGLSNIWGPGKQIRSQVHFYKKKQRSGVRVIRACRGLFRRSKLLLRALPSRGRRYLECHCREAESASCLAQDLAMNRIGLRCRSSVGLQARFVGRSFEA